MQELLTSLESQPWSLSLIIFIASVILGFIFEKIILIRLERIAAHTKWKGDDVLVKPLRGTFFIGFLIAGTYGALLNSHLDPAQLRKVETLTIVFGIFWATVVGARIATGFVDLYARRDGKAQKAISIFSTLAKLTIVIIGVLMILNTLGIEITPILTALGVGGLAVALALQDTLSNLFAGLQIIASKQVATGDYIKLDGGVEGYVVDISWRITRIRSASNNIIIVPNAKLSQALVTNYSQPGTEMQVALDVGLPYDIDLERAEKIMCEVATEVLKKVPGAIATFEPQVRFHTFADKRIIATVIMQGQEWSDQSLIKHEFIKLLHARSEKEKIKMLLPI